MEAHFELGNFAGPLDLLLYLVRKHGVTPAAGDAAPKKKFYPGQVFRDTLAILAAFTALYLTAALDPSGQARFYPDVYQRDTAELRALDGPIKVDLAGQTAY